MSSYPMKKLKASLLILGVMSCLVILASGLWIYQLNQQITEGLAQKKFLPPTQYYSAPEAFSIAEPTNRESFLKSLAARKYRSRDWSQKLFPGDYSESPQEICQASVPVSLPETASTCLLFLPLEVADPSPLAKTLQLVAWDEQGKLVGTFQGNPLAASESVQLEAQLFAQYLGEQPIIQDYKALGEIPPLCLNAVLAIEDSQFLEHSGFSITGIGRAVFNNVLGRSQQGGSTITQQMVKNYFLTAEKTLKRKLTELFMSILLEAHSSKDQILETYLNIIYLGQKGPFQIRGFSAASDYYFGKSLEELNLSECALLAAVLNSPGLYDPFKKPENSFKRRDLVLDRMINLQMVSSAEADEARKLPLPSEQQKLKLNETAPYYINAAQKEIQGIGYDFVGLKVFTGLRVQDQVAAQAAVQNHLQNLETKNKKIISLKEKGLNLEGTLISVENKSGLITALVGGRSFRQTQFNRAIEGHRQVGSIMKPFVFLTALLQTEGDKYDPLTELSDAKFTYKYEGQSWSPDNYEKKYYGTVPMYFALKNSLNASTASLGLKVGLNNIIETAHQAGIYSPLKNVPAMTLGAFELYPMEVAESYVTLARMGNHVRLATVRALANENGESLYVREWQTEQTLDAPSVAVLVGMMKQTVQAGTARYISASGFTIPTAGKTGTTSDNKDAWFAGFTPQKTAIVWVGYDQPTSNGLTGSSGAVPIWFQFMKSTVNPESAQDFGWPEGVEVRHVEKQEFDDKGAAKETLRFDLVFKK